MISGLSRPIVIGTVTTCTTPLACGQKPLDSRPASALRISGSSPIACGATSRSPASASTTPVLLVNTSNAALSCS